MRTTPWPVAVLNGMSLIVSALLIAAGTTHALQERNDSPKRERNFARWEKEIAALEKAERVNPSPPNAILFVGSSTIRLWDTLARDFADHQVINRGFGGSEIVDATHFADRIIVPIKPRMVILRSGGNDLNAGKSADEVFADFKDFVAKVHGKLPETEIAYLSLCPSIARWSQAEITKALNRKVEAFIKDKPRLRYIESYDISLDSDGKPRPELFIKDKLHLSPEGYKLLSERVRPHLPKTAPVPR